MLEDDEKTIKRCISRFIDKHSNKLNIEQNKETVIQIKVEDLLELCPSLFKDDPPLVREMRKKMVYNCVIKNEGDFKIMYIYPSFLQSK